MSPDEISITARTDSADDTRALAAAFARVVRPGDLVLLAGELGAGKTTFTQGLASSLGVTEAVTSPTFTLVRSYTLRTGEEGDENAGRIATLLHADLFRLEHLREVVDLGIGELLEDEAVALVEWGDVATPVLGEDALLVSLSHGTEPDVRIVTLNLAGPWLKRGQELTEALSPWLVTTHHRQE